MQAMTEAQGAVINGLLTLLAAIGGVFLGAILFGGRVRNIEDAIAQSKEAVNGHIENIETALTKVDATLTPVEGKLIGLDTRLATLDDLLNAMSEKVIQVADNQADAKEEGIAEPIIEQEDEQAGNPLSRGMIFSLWHTARDRLNTLASDPNIDGCTRAKYLRLDRHSYAPLIAALESDGVLTKTAADAAREAFKMRNGFRRRQSPPRAEEVAAMREWVDAIPKVPVGN